MLKTNSHVLTVTIEPVKGCNLCCRYCYADNRSGMVMSHDLLSMALEKIVRYVEKCGFNEIHFVWHGGEPLLAGIEFFRHAMAVLKNLTSATYCRHFIQTNGLLLDDEFCYFFRQMGFNVGISLDGPSDIHDRFRIKYNSEGTHTEVMEKVRLMEKHGLKMGFNTVINSVSKDKGHSIYKFFQDLGYGFRVNPIIPSWVSPLKNREFLLLEGEYGSLLCSLFDEWIGTSKTKKLWVSPLDNYLLAIVNGKVVECQHKTSCIGSSLGIKPNGDVVLCSRFEFPVLGNIWQMSVEEIFNSKVCNDLTGRAEILSECHLCINWPICHGGCPCNTFAFNRNYLKKDPFCKDYQTIFSCIRKKLTKPDSI